MAEPLKKGHVAVSSPDGGVFSVPESGLEEALRRGGKQLAPEELDEELHGGPAGMAKAAGLGFADTATYGLATPAALEIARALGGAEGQEELAGSIKDTRRVNPISAAIGEYAPFLAVPEAAPEMLAGEGASVATRLGAFVGSKFARGAAEVAWAEGAKGISEDALDHELAAESFYVHAMNPEVLLGGMLNVGVAGAGKGLGALVKRAAKGPTTVGGLVGSAALEDARVFEDAIATAQSAGKTTEEANAAIRDIQTAAMQRATATTAQEKKVADRLADEIIKRHAGSDVAAKRQFQFVYEHGRKWAQIADDTFTTRASEANQHITDLLNSEAKADRAQFGLKQQEIQRLIDPTQIAHQKDAAIRFVRTMDAMLHEPALPEAVKPLEAFQKEIRKELRASELFPGKPPKAPAPKRGSLPKEQGRFAKELEARAAAHGEERLLYESDVAGHAARMEAFEAEVQRVAAERHAAAVAAHEAESARIISEHDALVPPEVRQMFGQAELELRLGMPHSGKGGVSQWDSLLKRMRIAIAKGDSSAELFTLMDDAKRIVGQYAQYGRENFGTGAQFSSYMYQNHLQPVLENAGLWGDGLATMQRETNEAFSVGKKPSSKFAQAFGESLDNDRAGRPIYKGLHNRTRGFLEWLGTPENETMEKEVVQRAIERAKHRAVVLKKNMNLGPEELAEVNRMAEAAAKLEKVIESTRQFSADVRAIQSMKKMETSSGVGGIMGKALGAYTSPVKTLETLSSVSSAGKAVKSWLSGETKAFVREGAKAPIVPGLVSKMDEEATVRAIEDVRQYAREPRNMALAMKNAIEPVADGNPQLASAIANVVARGLLFLSQSAPQPLAPRFGDKPGEVRYARSDLERWYRQKQLFENPKLVYQRMRSGQLHQEDIKSANAMFPRLMDEMRSTLYSEMMELKKAGKLRTMTYQEQQRMSWMLGAPLDPTSTPEYVSYMQRSAAQDPVNQASIGMQAEGGGRPRGSFDIDIERTKTLTDQMEE